MLVYGIREICIDVGNKPVFIRGGENVWFGEIRWGQVKRRLVCEKKSIEVGKGNLNQGKGIAGAIRQSEIAFMRYCFCP